MDLKPNSNSFILLLKPNINHKIDQLKYLLLNMFNEIKK